jgi:hypothetical protein
MKTLIIAAITAIAGYMAMPAAENNAIRIEQMDHHAGVIKVSNKTWEPAKVRVQMGNKVAHVTVPADWAIGLKIRTDSAIIVRARVIESKIIDELDIDDIKIRTVPCN